MKKILLILLVFLSFIRVNALSIDKMYIDSEIDISGNLLVKEVIEINNLNEDFDYKLYFKDMNLTLNDKNYYDGINISIENIGLLSEDYDLNLLNKDDFKKYIKESNNIETIKNDNNYSVKIKKNNKKTYIYIDYMVLSLSVIHNDIAEFYYKYLNNLEYDIKELKIIFKLPYSSDTFDVYAHSNMKADISKDDKNYLVIIQKRDYKKDNDLDLRVLYDKDLYQVVYNKDKKSNIDALDMIKNIENERISNTKRNNTLPYVFISVIAILIAFIIIFIAKYKHIKK